MRNKGMRNESIKKHLNIHKKRLTAAVAAVLAVIVLLAAVPVMRAQAEYDLSNAVRYSTFSQSHTIEDSVLFIGTHLIHIQAMTDELYNKAVQTMTDSGQDSIYYKSELANGTWYDITEASSLSDITAAGKTMVSEDELNPLYVEYYTGADGITKSAKTDASVCIFDNPDPYDLMKLPELEVVRKFRSQSYNEEGEGPHKFLYQALNSFFSSDVKNETTRECDRAIKNLQKLYEVYCTAGMDEDAQVISSLMESVDATRRAEVYAKLCQDGEPQVVTSWFGMLNLSYTIPNYSLLSGLSKSVGGSGYDEKSETYNEMPFEYDANLMSAVSTSIGECNTSYSSYASKALAPGGSAISNYIYEQMRSLVDKCETTGSLSISSEITGLVNNIKYAQNIQNGVVGDAEAESRLLDEKFLPPATDAYTKALQVGTSDDYKAAVSANKSDTAKQAILKDDATDLDVARTALQTMITAKKERMSSSDAIKYLYERITWTYDQEKGIPSDDFASFAKQSAADHIEWLTDLAKKIVDGDVSLMSELDRLKALLSEYLKKWQDALDDGNLVLASQYKDLADKTSKRIAAEKARLNDILNSETASEAEKAEARVALGETGLLNDIDKLLSDILRALNEDDTSNLQSMLDLLATYGAENALKNAKDALADSNLSSGDKDKWSDKLDQAIASSKDSSLHDKANASAVADGSGTGDGTGSGSGTGDGTGDGSGSGTGDGTGSGDGTGDGTGSGDGTGTGSSDTNPATMSETALLNAIEQILGGSFDELDAEGKIAASAAIDRLFDDYSNVNAKKLAARFITKCMSEGNIYAYTQLSGHTETEYIPISTLNKPVTLFRYVYNDSKHEATMTRGSTTLRFRVGANIVTLTDGTEQEIKNYKVEFQNTPYIDENTAKTYFDCESEYIVDTRYAACLTKSIREKADALYKALTGQS